MNSPISVVNQLVKHFSLPLTHNVIKEELEQHPDYPSLLSVSDVLKEWDISNTAYEVDVEDLKQITSPFIAHISAKGGLFVFVKKINEDSLLVNDVHGVEKNVTITEFSSYFTGNVLLLEPGAQSGDRN